MKNVFVDEIPSPFVSVIVPVYNDAQRIGKCIESLLQQTYPREKYEVIVIDNGSTDETLEVIKKYSVKLLIEDKIQSSYAARNKGIKNARGEVIAFTDSDCIPDPDWIEKGVNNLLRVPNCGLVAGKINMFFKNPEEPNAVELYDKIKGFSQKEDVEKSKFGSTANVFTFKKVFENVGLFNDRLKSGGDNEWGRRVFSFGYQQVYAEDTCIAHPTRYTFGELNKRIRRLAGGNYDQSKSKFHFIKYWVRSIKHTVSPIIKAIFGMYPVDQLHGTKQKIKFILVCLYVGFIQNYETVQLLITGKSKR